MNHKFCPGSGNPLSVVALLLVAACGNSGSDFGSTTGTGSTGTNGSGTNGSGTAGSSVSGGTAGDSTSSGSGGDPSGGAGGNVTPGTGGDGVGMGGANGVGGSTPGAGGGGGSGSMPCLNGYKPPQPDGGVGAPICHEFYANDNSKNQINYVNQFTSTKPGGVVWVQPVGDAGENSPRTLEIVNNPKAAGGKAILASLNKGFAEFDATTGEKLVSVLTQTGVTGATRLPDGNTALGISNVIRIVSPTGAQVRQFNIPAGGELRAINRNPTTGNFWFSKTETIYETNDQGQEVWKGYMGAGTKGYAVWWREGGGAYATTGEPASIVEVIGPSGATTIKSTVGGQGAMFPFLDFFSGFVRLPNGNYVVANWLGHLPNVSVEPWLSAPQVIEFKAPPANEVVWQWECPTCPQKNQTLSRQITNVLVVR